MQKLNRAFAVYVCVAYMSCSACAKTLLSFCVYEQRLCRVFAVYVFATHVNRSENRKPDRFTASHRCVCAQKLGRAFAVTVWMSYISFFFFFIKCMQSMAMTLSRRCMYAKLHVTWPKSLLYIFSLINHTDSLRIRARELSIWSSDHIDNSKLWKLVTSTWAFDLSVWLSSQAG